MLSSVVKFPNSACTSSTAGRNGTCYTSSECSAASGTASGSCASSFGVCCIFEKSCGADPVSQNLTYFTSSSRSLGAACPLAICKASSDIKKRLTYFHKHLYFWLAELRSASP